MNPYFWDKLQAVADDLAQAGYRATLEAGPSLVTDAPKRNVRMAMARAHVEFYRQLDRCGFSWRYTF